MSKKRKGFRTSTSKKYNDSQRTSKQPATDQKTENAILKLLFLEKNGLSYRELAKSCAQKDMHIKTFKSAVVSLEHSAMITKTGDKNYILSEKCTLYTGLLTCHPKGFGFVEATGVSRKSPPLLRDAYISRNHMGDAQHGDKVLVRVLKDRQRGRSEGLVIDVVQQGDDTICGIVRIENQEILVYPDDIRFPFLVRLAHDENKKSHKLVSGQAVSVRYKRSVRPVKILEGSLLSVLGSIEKIDTQKRLVIEKFHLPYQFTEKVQQETTQLVDEFHLGEDRIDLRHILHCTIDGATAKDFDDAICVEENDDGFRLYVSIADVSHFVLPGSAIDREAYLRGTSVYFPERVIPMLPELLSNDLCSLIPGEDRYCLTAILDYDHSGRLRNKNFSRSLIHSHHRFTYSRVNEILQDKSSIQADDCQKMFGPLQNAEKLASLLLTNRRAKGAIEFSLAEPYFTHDEEGRIKDIQKIKRNFAHQIIEEFMLAANLAVAEFLEDRKFPTIFRIHEQPGNQDLKEAAAFITKLGLPIASVKNDPIWFSKAIEACKDTNFQYIVNNLLLRCMQQAKYSDANTGHFGLASSSYTHFTSPIRRYPDLMVHRHLLFLLGNPEKRKQRHRGARSLIKEAEFLSTRERTAVNAERDMHERLKVAFMKNHIGKTFDAIISGVSEKGLFIEISKHCISGRIPIEDFTDDYYIYDSGNYRLFGEISMKIYQIGDRVKVKVIAVDLYRKKIMFQLISLKNK